MDCKAKLNEEIMKTNFDYEKPEMIEYPYFGVCGAGVTGAAPGGDVTPPSCDDFTSPND